MKFKGSKYLGKVLMMMLAVLFVTAIVNAVPVSADSGETVRVSTSKELAAAIKNSEATTIILRTEADIKVTIKADKNAENKMLIIDAHRARVTNKAKFLLVDIQDAQSYTESANGNYILLQADLCEFTLAKNKNIEQLEVMNPLSMEGNLSYKVCKGAKVDKIVISYTGNDVATSVFDSKKKTATISYTDEYGYDHNYIYGFDKNGRIATVKDTVGDFGADITFKYKSNGDVASISEVSGRGETVTTYKYDSKGNAVEVYSDIDGDFTKQVIDYDKKGQVKSIVFYTSTFEEGKEPVGDTRYEYDKKGRVTSYGALGFDSSYYDNYKYNSKGFVTEETVTYNGIVYSVTKYKYNKKGDLLQKTMTNDEGDTYVTKYTYDDLGKCLKEEEIDPQGKSTVTDITE